jgi:hypothetical protein
MRQMKLLRGTGFVLGGICWIAAALVLGSFLFHYIAQGAGLQLLPFATSSGSVLIGLLHTVGFAGAVAVCFAVGAGLCAHGLVPPAATRRELAKARRVADTSNQFSIRFCEVGRTLEYSDVNGQIEFAFSVGSTEDKSLFLECHTSRFFDGSRYKIAFERTTQFLVSQGFLVETSDR